MSSIDMLGPAIRAAGDVPQDRLNTLEKVAKRLSYDKPDGRPHGEVWDAYLRKIVADGLPDWAYLLDIEAAVVELGEFTVDYDATLETKLGSISGRKVIRTGRTFGLRSDLSPGRFRPTPLKGSVRYKASAVSFNKSLSRFVIEEWCRQKKKAAAGLAEAIDCVLSIPLLKFAKALPIVAIGECFYDTFEYTWSTKFLENGDTLLLDYVKFEGGKNPSLWEPGWHFLVLEKVEPVDVD